MLASAAMMEHSRPKTAGNLVKLYVLAVYKIKFWTQDAGLLSYEVESNLRVWSPSLGRERKHCSCAVSTMSSQKYSLKKVRFQAIEDSVLRCQKNIVKTD